MSDYSSVLGVIHDHDPMKACSSLFFWGGGGGGKEDLVRVLKKGSVDRCTLILSNFGPIRRPPVGSMVKALVS